MEKTGLGAVKVLHACQALPPLNPRQQAKVERLPAKVKVNSLFTDPTDKYAAAIVMEMILAQAKAKN